MYELRVRVFSHLQRLSLDFYTDEKAGRLMTRMTSDIEALHAALPGRPGQHGRPGPDARRRQRGALQLNVRLAAHHALASWSRCMVVLTLWFRGASDRGYAPVRDRIADVLADLPGEPGRHPHRRRPQPPRHNVVNHRNVVGEHRDANDYTARVGGHLRARHRGARRRRPGR